MKTIPVMEMRKHLGAVLDEERLRSETIVVERAGKPIAMICPVDTQEAPNESVKRKLKAVRDMAGINPDSDRAADIDAWLQSERDSWE